MIILEAYCRVSYREMAGLMKPKLFRSFASNIL
jgi:hypothetical protein